MRTHDDIPKLLDMCQHDTLRRPLAQVALERYRLVVTGLAYGPGTEEAKQEAIEKARQAFEWELRNILVPFFDSVAKPGQEDQQKDNQERPPASDPNH